MRFNLILVIVLGLAQMSTAFGEGMIFKERIVGGVNAQSTDAPFIVSLRNGGQHFCGGTLIGKSWVLTASHCIAGYKAEEVVIGATKVSGNDAVETFKVEKIIGHPDFGKPLEMANDFALIKFKGVSSVTPALLNDVEPSLLNLPSFTVAGWGNTSEFSYYGSSLLQIVDVPFVDQKVCEKQLQDYEPNEDGYLDETMFCAGYEEGKKDACQGDSGGPLYYKNNSNDFVVAGVVSWGIGCARKDQSGIYSDVSSVTKWINATIVK